MPSRPPSLRWVRLSVVPPFRFVRRFFRRLAIPFAWRDVATVGANTYVENAITGRRLARPASRCFSPINWDWVDGLVDDPREFDPPPPPPGRRG